MSNWQANWTLFSPTTESLISQESTYTRINVTSNQGTHTGIQYSNVSRYSIVGHYFYILADGNAVNFLHGAVVGPYIYLVQAEILVAMSKITEKLSSGFYEVSELDRQKIANAWLTHFNR